MRENKNKGYRCNEGEYRYEGERCFGAEKRRLEKDVTLMTERVRRPKEAED